MSDITAILLGGVLGAIGMYWLFNFFRQKKEKERTEQQSVILLEKIKTVCKLISVEGDFTEIYTYENTKELFLSLFSSKKKALIVVKAKAHIGYDLKKVQIKAHPETKKVSLMHFPQPEILSVAPELQFYDIKNGLFNSFSPDDLTSLNQEVKSYITEKIPESGLMETAQREALETILIMEKIVETIGWKLDYSALALSLDGVGILEQKTDN
ncbi:DUF4230 domain-containing protein [Spongiimicrobium salis]|uniref:DUF4230 domain-containing protein n=1 Tax=Spongiimicrobium salis TaxID=1667022 RepID=UPI00374D8660